jgi:hypothetical protein
VKFCLDKTEEEEKRKVKPHMRNSWAFGFDLGLVLKRQRSTTHPKPA